MVWLMPLQTGTKRREPEREMQRGNEGGRRGEVRGAREAEDGCEEKRERDNALNTRGSCCALMWTLQRGRRIQVSAALFQPGLNAATPRLHQLRGTAWLSARGGNDLLFID